MAKDIDSELATNVKAAKTKRTYFAFVAKGSSDGAPGACQDESAAGVDYRRKKKIRRNASRQGRLLRRRGEARLRDGERTARDHGGRAQEGHSSRRRLDASVRLPHRHCSGSGRRRRGDWQTDHCGAEG